MVWLPTRANLSQTDVYGGSFNSLCAWCTKIREKENHLFTTYDYVITQYFIVFF